MTDYAPVIEEPVVSNENTLPDDTRDSMQQVEENNTDTEINVAHLAETLSAIDAAHSTMLKMSKIKVRDGIYYVVTQDIFKKAMSDNEKFSASLKGLLKCEHIKYVTEAEFNGTEINDPLDEILSMAGDVDQISIF